MPARRSPIGTSYHSRESLPADESPANRSSWRRSAEIAGAPTILKGEVVSPGIMKIIRLEESTSENQWELARLYARELAKPGMTTRELGNLVSKSHTYVRLMAKTWTEKGAGLADSLPPFSEMYALAKAPKPKPDPKPGTEDTGAGFSYDELVKCGAGTRQASDQQFSRYWLRSAGRRGWSPAPAGRQPPSSGWRSPSRRRRSCCGRRRPRVPRPCLTAPVLSPDVRASRARCTGRRHEVSGR